MSLKNLKILMIAPTPFFADRGCHVRIYEEIKFLRQKGHEVILLTYPIGDDIEGVDIRRVPGAPWYRKLTAGASLHKFYLDPLLAVWGTWLAFTEKPDIIHVHLHEGIAIGLPISFLTRRPMMADLQGSMVEELIDHRSITRNSVVARILRRVEKSLSRLAGHIIVSSQNTARALEKSYALEEGMISCVGDGVDLQEFRPQSPPAELRRRLSIADDARVVVFLGLLTEYQGVDVLLEAFTHVVNSVPGAHLLLMGYPDEDYYLEKAASLMLSDNITLTGRVPYREAGDYLALGEVAVAPKMSLTEANGKLYNYMACGLPVVAFDTPVNREILGFKGIYARFGDKDSLADFIISLLRSPEKAGETGAELRKKVEASYSWERSIHRILSCYGEILTGESTIATSPDGGFSARSVPSETLSDSEDEKEILQGSSLSDE